MDSGNVAWVLVSAALVLFMTPGLAFFYGGMDRSRNVLNMLMMNFYCLLVVPIVWVVVGFSLAQVPFDNGFIGNFDAAFLKDIAITGEDGGMTLATIAFLGMFAAITPALISGAVADRMKFSAWAIFVPVWSLIVYVPVFKWVYGGWLYERGSIDFAGGTAIHVNAGIAALAAVMVLGKRKGWPSEGHPPHSMPLVMIGTGILWFGWFGFNAASTFASSDIQFATVATNTAIAAAVGATVAMFWVTWRTGKPDPGMMVNGMLAGLVAITAPCAFVGPWAAAVIGLIAAIVVIEFAWWLDRKGVDDPVGAVAVHGIGGTLGVLFVGIFANGKYGAAWNGSDSTGVEGILYGDAGQLGAQALGAVVIWTVILGIAFAFFKIQNKLTKDGGIRISEEMEIEGSDLPEMGVMAYND